MEQPWEQNGVAFANIVMARIENQILSQSCIKPLFGKGILMMCCHYGTSLENKESFVEKANDFLSTIKFTAEMSEVEISFLNTKVYKGARFDKESILDVQTHYKPTETFEYMNFYSSHPPDVKKGFIKGMLKEKRSCYYGLIPCRSHLRGILETIKTAR